jgi:putative transposase
LKYRPDFPGRFGGYEDAESHCRRFFDWYANEHRHSDIVMLTPADAHTGRAAAVIAKRQAVLDQAYAKWSDRFTKRPMHPKLPERVWINDPIKATKLTEVA